MAHRPKLHRRTILLALSIYDVRLHRSVLRYGRLHGWDVVLMQPDNWKLFANQKADGIISLIEDERDTHGMTRVIHGHAFRQIKSKIRSSGMTEHLISRGIPMVDFSRERPALKIARIWPDNFAAGKLAAEHLLAKCKEVEQDGRQFLFLANVKNPNETERWEGFRKTLARHGERASSLFLAGKKINDVRKLRVALAAMRRPLALYCTYDVVAESALNACLEAKWQVPEEVMILGGYNHELISEFAVVPLSTIDMNIEVRGYTAAALLDKIMRGKADPLTTIRTPIAGVIERVSTHIDASRNPRIAIAMEFIGSNLHKAISVDDVAEVTSASRSSMQQQFRQFFGHGVGEEIIHQRIEKAKQLLQSTALKTTSVSEAVGYTSACNFFRLFKRLTGFTPDAYRRNRQDGD